MADDPIVARTEVIPGPVTLALQAASDRYWCPCHHYHRHDGPDGMTCPSEVLPEGKGDGIA